MFEAKLAGYATKLQFGELERKLAHFARTEATERITEDVRMLATKFDMYTRSARVDQQIQDLRDWVTDELMSYALVGQTRQKLDDITDTVRQNSQSLERVCGMLDDKVR